MSKKNKRNAHKNFSVFHFCSIPMQPNFFSPWWVACLSRDTTTISSTDSATGKSKILTRSSSFLVHCLTKRQLWHIELWLLSLFFFQLMPAVHLKDLRLEDSSSCWLWYELQFSLKADKGIKIIDLVNDKKKIIIITTHLSASAWRTLICLRQILLKTLIKYYWDFKL